MTYSIAGKDSLQSKPIMIDPRPENIPFSNTIFKGEKHTGRGDKKNTNPESAINYFLEEKQGETCGGNNLEIVQ